MTDAAGYAVLTEQQQTDELITRLHSLELEHFRQSAMAEEAEAVKDLAALEQHRAAVAAVSLRCEFVRGKLAARNAFDAVPASAL